MAGCLSDVRLYPLQGVFSAKAAQHVDCNMHGQFMQDRLAGDAGGQVLPASWREVQILSTHVERFWSILLSCVWN